MGFNKQSKEEVHDTVKIARKTGALDSHKHSSRAKMKQMNTLMPGSLIERLEQYVFDHKSNKSEVVRQQLEKFLSSRGY